VATIRASADGAVLDFRLNLLGIRVWEGHCCLISRRSDDWQPIGKPYELPVRIPRAYELGYGWLDDELHITAYQFHQEYPEAHLDAILAGRTDFRRILRALSMTEVHKKPPEAVVS
jgi:hypothetical protein